MGLVDVAVLGRLGARELAGAGLGNAIFFAFSIIGMGMVMGVDPLISQAIGAGDRVRARHVLWQGIWLSLVVAGVLTLVLLGGAAALPHIGVGAGAGRAGDAPTCSSACVSLVPFLLFFVVRAYLQAHGITRPLLVVDGRGEHRQPRRSTSCSCSAEAACRSGPDRCSASRRWAWPAPRWRRWSARSCSW